MSWLKGKKQRLLMFHEGKVAIYRQNPAPSKGFDSLVEWQLEEDLFKRLTMHMENVLWWDLCNNKHRLILEAVKHDLA